MQQSSCSSNREVSPQASRGSTLPCFYHSVSLWISSWATSGSLLQGAERPDQKLNVNKFSGDIYAHKNSRVEDVVGGHYSDTDRP